jgi:cytochrome c oxidase cbb3-type subunit III
MNMLNKIPVLRKILLATTLLFISAAPVFSQPPPKSSLQNNTMAWMLILVMAVLLLVIIILGNIIMKAKSVYRDRMREEKNKETASSGIATALLPLLLFITSSASAQTTPAATPKTVKLIGGLDPLTFYFMIGIILLEVVVIMALIYILLMLVGIKWPALPKTSLAPGKKFNWWWGKLNQAVSMEKEKDIDLDHDYDGIRELDNKVPPWWTWAFVFTIVFGLFYMWRYHVGKSAPLQHEEFMIAMQKGEEKKQAYLKNAANNVDENTIAMLDAAGIAAGKDLYAAKQCITCHGAAGEGAAVGPNLADDYWIHGGSLANIFKSIKYGWPDKGMRSWKDELSPVQMAQLSSFVKSLKGSNPPNAKPPQGDLYSETADTLATTAKQPPADSLKKPAPDTLKNKATPKTP